MLPIVITILTVLVIIVLALLVVVIKNITADRQDTARQSATVNLLQQQLEAIRSAQDASAQAMTKNLQIGQENVGKFLQTSQETLTKLHTQIGHLQGAGEQMLQLGTNVQSLQNILKNPKLRGQMGERSLENILSEVLPSRSFALQHTFRNGKIVDALVQLPDYSVSIDAKFPLPSFEAMINAADQDQQAKLRRQFQGDVIKHIDKIAESYINQDEGTLDFALMYIPAENIYYETIVNYGSDRIDVLDYAMKKKVISVSPNLLYAYLMTIVMGLHGLQIEKQAAQICRDLSRVATGFGAFVGTWETLGRHLRNAQSQYEEGQGRLNKFNLELERIQNTDDNQAAP